MLSRMRLTYENVAVVVANDDEGLIIFYDFAQLNWILLECLCRVLRRPGGTSGGVSNPGVAVSDMAESNLQGMIYYIKHFKRIGRTFTHTYVDIYKVRAM